MTRQNKNEPAPMRAEVEPPLNPIRKDRIKLWHCSECYDPVDIIIPAGHPDPDHYICSRCADNDVPPEFV